MSSVRLSEWEVGRSDRARERRARAVLTRVAEPGNLKLFNSVARIGAEAVVAGLCREAAGDVALLDLRTRLDSADPERDLAAATRVGGRFLIPADDEWPTAVDDLAHVKGTAPPLGLWVRGPVRLDELGGAVAVVGSRSSTTYGESQAFEIAAECAREGRVVISGGAFGIDQAAHRGAIAAGGRSVAVLAGGVDRFYPRASSAVLEHMARHGAVISEVPPGSAPTRGRFLVRNRLIAALATGTVVIEAALRSGALNTLGWADQLNRLVMGLPGPVTSVQSEGINDALRSGKASLVTSGPEVLELVSPAGTATVAPKRGPSRPRDQLDVYEHRVLDAVPVSSPRSAESIAVAAGVSVERVLPALQRLASLGLVDGRSGRWRLCTTSA